MTRKALENLSWPELSLTFVGTLGVLFACYVGYWYLAQQMAWWTYGLTMIGVFVFWTFVKELFKEIRK